MSIIRSVGQCSEGRSCNQVTVWMKNNILTGMGCQRGMPQQGVRTRSCLYPRKSDMIPWPVDLRMSLSWGSLYSKTPCVRAQNIRPNVRTWWARTLGSQEMLSAESLEPSRAQSLPEKGAMLGLRGTRAASVSRKKKKNGKEWATRRNDCPACRGPTSHQVSTDKRVSGMKPPEAKERTTEKEKDTREQYSGIPWRQN